MVMTNSTFTIQPFAWDALRVRAAMRLATGTSKTKVAEELRIDRKTLYHWLNHADFAAEVDRLSLMIGIAGRAERMRICMQVVESKLQDEWPKTDKDLLDWLKFAQSETDGAKVDLSKLRELLMPEEVEEPSRLVSQSAIAADVRQRYNEPLSLPDSPLENIIDVPQEQPTATDDGERD